ncbi:probable serine/threonine-protein kinase CST isoform X2 [Amaranthus tricolor]|uniref:probable serine/threonine-protein kinase CST isoform X2 n=1 Tax=Amaranthus tricolor TaxID=29722 RepID=UPI002586F5ED|nr:probable serine/threonine-protein kinase CST isoform X2 [Amaranthus tricolor]
MGNCWGSEQQLTNPSDVRTVESVPAPVGHGLIASCNGGGAKVGPPEMGRQIIKPSPKEYKYADLKSATKNFKCDYMIGEGGFGKVYKGWIDEKTLAPSTPDVGIPVAVKKCSANSTHALKQWKTEIDFLGKCCHPNLVKLIGYCWEEKELLLVYEYMNYEKVKPPSWNTRLTIAIDAARGLHFLHTSENTVIFRDFKTANILLDQNYAAKLSDFGLARLGPSMDKSHVTTQAMGTYGYAAPEYINTGHLYVRSDVYGFGVVLLEMLTGLKAYDVKRPSGQTCLVDWYKTMLNEKPKVKKIIDPRMDVYPPEGVNKLAQLILRCLQNDPKNRPSMSEVLKILERISTIKMNPKSPSPSSSKPDKPNAYHSSLPHYKHGGRSSSTRQTYPLLQPST